MSGNVLAEERSSPTSLPSAIQMLINNQTPTANQANSNASSSLYTTINGSDDNNNNNNVKIMDVANSGLTTKLDGSSSNVEQQQQQQQSTISATRSTPQSQSSSISTPTSSSSQGKMSGSNNSSHTTTSIAKFKEKRPEPLKLNPDFNQDIPLNLSTKSAGNVPIGLSGNVFNLSSANKLTTLETPRIIWQDNETLLIKPRHFSSTSSANQMIRLSSLAGDSPPITPSTPFGLENMICSPTITSTGTSLQLTHQQQQSLRHHLHQLNQQHNQLSQYNNSHHQQQAAAAAAAAAYYHNQPKSAGFLHDPGAFQALMQMHYTRHLEDNYLMRQTRVALNKQAKNTIDKAPRRSCSTEELSLMNNQRTAGIQLMKDQMRDMLHALNDNNNRRNSSLSSNNNNKSDGHITDRFSYSNKHTQRQTTTTTNTSSSNRASNERQPSISPIVNVTGNDNSQSSMDTTCSIQQVSGVNNQQQQQNQNQKALTPTSVAKATVNLLNINLNSPPTNPPQNTNMFDHQSATSFAATVNELIETHKLGACGQNNSTSSSSGLSSASQHQHQAMISTSNISNFNQLDPLLSSLYAPHQHTQDSSSHKNYSYQSFSSNNNQRGAAERRNQQSLNSTSSSSSAFYQHHTYANITTTSASSSSAPNQLNNQQGGAFNNINSNSGSFGGSTTLNTPTLISPSHFKGGSLCFLPSPTLSPMSVFELPLASPMFPTNPPQAIRSQVNVSSSSSSTTTSTIKNIPDSTQADKTMKLEHHQLELQNQLLPTSGGGGGGHCSLKSASDEALEERGGHVFISSGQQNQEASSSENNLIHLVTSAKDKFGASAVGEEESGEVQMDVEQMDFVECCNDNETKLGRVQVRQTKSAAANSFGAVSSIPRIFVTNSPHRQQQQQQQAALASGQQTQWPSDNNNNNTKMTDAYSPEAETQERSQREPIGKRALSPQTFKSRVNLYHSERFESSSAPPDVYEGRARSKLKCATDSCVNLWPQASSDLITEANQSTLVHPNEQQQQQQQPPPNFHHHFSSLNGAPYTEPTSVTRNGWSLQQQQQQNQSIACSSITGGYLDSNNVDVGERGGNFLQSANSDSGGLLLSARSNSAEPPRTNQQLSWEQLNEFKRQQCTGTGSGLETVGSSNSQSQHQLPTFALAAAAAAAMTNSSQSANVAPAQSYHFSQSAQHLPNCSTSRSSFGVGGSSSSSNQNVKPHQQRTASLAQSSQTQLSLSQFPNHQLQQQQHQHHHHQQHQQHQQLKYTQSNSVGHSLNCISGSSASCSSLQFADAVHYPQQTQQQQQIQQQQPHQHQLQQQQQQMRLAPLVQGTNPPANNHLASNMRHQQHQSGNLALLHQSAASSVPILASSSSSGNSNQATLTAAGSVAASAQGQQTLGSYGEQLHRLAQPQQHKNHQQRALSAELVAASGRGSSVGYSELAAGTGEVYGTDSISRSESSCEFNRLGLGSFRSSSAFGVSEGAGGGGNGGGGGVKLNLNSNSSSPCGAVKKYRCEECSKAFTRSDMLTRHRRLHSGDRPFQCNECKQEFSRSDHLSTHMRTHTGEKPYKCKLCSYSACRKDMITRHMKVHNRSSPNEVSMELAR